MAITDTAGLPIAYSHEVTLVDQAIDSLFIEELPEKLISDKAYDSDSLDKDLRERGCRPDCPSS